MPDTPNTPPSDILHDTVLTVDLAALRQNYQTLSAKAGLAETAAVVKANAYGLGIEQAAPALADAGARKFFVAQLHEAIDLRQVFTDKGLTHDIFVFAGVRSGQEELFADNSLIPVLNTLDQLDRWREFSKANGTQAAVIHVDSGMSRLGLERSQVEELKSNPERLKYLDLKYVMSHLACADEPDHPLNQKQLEWFRAARDALPDMPASLANSGGILLGPDYHFDLVRPGIGLYGGNPQPGHDNPVSPVVSLSAAVVQIRHVEVGETVGYGATFTAQRPSKIAILALGYADGMLRALSNLGHITIAGQKAPYAGRVSMDLIAIDVTDIPEGHVQEGGSVEVFGADPDLNNLAEVAGTISYEFLTLLGKRYKRVYTG